MRRLFTAAESGLTKDALQWGERTGRWRRAHRGVYAEGPEPVTALDAARAKVLASTSAARAALAGVLHDLDGVTLQPSPRKRDQLPPDRIVIAGGVPCASPIQTMVDLASVLDDDRWEQALGFDGQHHAGQPVYDARRETAVVAATGWLPGRFTWHEVVQPPRSTTRRLDGLAFQAIRRPAA